MVPKGKLMILTVKTSPEILYELENTKYNTFIMQHKCRKNITTLNDKLQFVKKIWNNKVTKKKKLLDIWKLTMDDFIWKIYTSAKH